MDDLKESVNQRFDDMNEASTNASRALTNASTALINGFDDVKERLDSLEKLLNWQNRMMMGILAVILAAAVKYLFFPG